MPFHEIVAIRSPLSICRGIAIREGKVEGRTRTGTSADRRTDFVFEYDAGRGKNINNRPICSTDTSFVFLLVESDSEK